MGTPHSNQTKGPSLPLPEQATPAKQGPEMPIQASAPSEQEGLKQQVMDLTDLLKHVQADYVNFKNRVARDKDDLIKEANKKIITDLLSVLDVFDLALGSLKEHTETTKGFEMVHVQLLDILKRHGLHQINQVDVPADLMMHEVIRTSASTKKPNLVLEIIQKGYKLYDRVLRPAKVVVSQNPANTQ